MGAKAGEAEADLNALLNYELTIKFEPLKGLLAAVLERLTRLEGSEERLTKENASLHKAVAVLESAVQAQADEHGTAHRVLHQELVALQASMTPPPAATFTASEELLVQELASRILSLEGAAPGTAPVPPPNADQRWRGSLTGAVEALQGLSQRVFVLESQQKTVDRVNNLGQRVDRVELAAAGAASSSRAPQADPQDSDALSRHAQELAYLKVAVAALEKEVATQPGAAGDTAAGLRQLQAWAPAITSSLLTMLGEGSAGGAEATVAPVEGGSSSSARGDNGPRGDDAELGAGVDASALTRVQQHLGLPLDLQALRISAAARPMTAREDLDAAVAAAFLARAQESQRNVQEDTVVRVEGRNVPVPSPSPRSNSSSTGAAELLASAEAAAAAAAAAAVAPLAVSVTGLAGDVLQLATAVSGLEARVDGLASELHDMKAAAVAAAQTTVVTPSAVAPAAAVLPSPPSEPPFIPPSLRRPPEEADAPPPSPDAGKGWDPKGSGKAPWGRCLSCETPLDCTSSGDATAGVVGYPYLSSSPPAQEREAFNAKQGLPQARPHTVACSRGTGSVGRMRSSSPQPRGAISATTTSLDPGAGSPHGGWGFDGNVILSGSPSLLQMQHQHAMEASAAAATWAVGAPGAQQLPSPTTHQPQRPHRHHSPERCPMNGPGSPVGGADTTAAAAAKPGPGGQPELRASACVTPTTTSTALVAHPFELQATSGGGAGPVPLSAVGRGGSSYLRLSNGHVIRPKSGMIFNAPRPHSSGEAAGGAPASKSVTGPGGAR